MTNPALEDRDGPRDECGVFGICAPGRDVARMAYFSLYALQHRGQESAGIATCEGGHITTLRDTGLVSQVFTEERLSALEGDMAIGHVRYSTSGAKGQTQIRDVQPLFAEFAMGGCAIAHNGNVTNADPLREQLKERGSIFQSSSDTETRRGVPPRNSPTRAT